MSVAETTAPSPPRPDVRARILRWGGWTLITAGVVVLLYLVYALLFTNLETDRAQAELLEAWNARLEQAEDAAAGAAAGDPVTGDAIPTPAGDASAAPDDDPTLSGAPDDDPSVSAAPEAPAELAGGAVAMLEFVRPGSDEPIVHDGPLLVVAGVSAADLRQGPGHYPGTAGPGEPGNFAVAGHRTTYGAPFFSLDELEPGDEVHVTAPDGRRHVYAVVTQEIVAPAAVEVLDPDALGRGRPLLTLTTCHPRFSAAERLVVHAELVR